MKFIESRPKVIALCLVLIVLSTVYGAHRSLTKEKNKIEELFYIGVTNMGGGIESDLQKRLDYAYNLTTIARNYADAFADEVKAVDSARQNLAASGGASEKFRLNNQLTMAVGDLYEAMVTYEAMSEKDIKYRDEVYANLSSRNDIINNEAVRYNQKAREFNTEILGTFPANFLKYSAFVGPVEIFG